MSNINSMKKEISGTEKPSLFRAAKNNDLGEMERGLGDGQSLAETRKDGMNPVHVAAEHGSEDFVVAAVEIDPAAANAVDQFGRRPFDYAEGRSDSTAMTALSAAMYPEGEVMKVDF